jgi:hypothetical protein
MSQLKVNSIIPTAGVPTGGGGGITQVKSVTDTVRHTTGSVSLNQTYADTPFAVTLTPTSSSNLMLISGFFMGEPSTNEHQIHFAVKRAVSGGSTTIIQGAADGVRGTCISVPNQGYFDNNNDSTPFNISFNGLLDSPSTTSAVTYTIVVRLASGSGTLYYNRTANDGNFDSLERGLSWLTVMEVSG